MPAPTRSRSRSSTPLGAAKDRCRAAYRAARDGDAAMGALFDRWWSETIEAVKGQPAERSAVMLTRTAIMFEVLVDRRGWPEHIR
jgi:hypothetical protein